MRALRIRFSRATLFKVVAFALVSALFTLALAARIGNLRPFAHTYRLQAMFANASGVFKGDAVKLAGVDVGRVTGAEIRGGQALVTFDVDQAVKLPTDTVVSIRWRNVLGQRFLYVYPGSAHGSFLHDGSVIPMAQTQDAGDLDQFLNELGPILRAIDPEKANAFLDAVNGALSGNEANVRQLIGDGASLASNLASMDQQIQTLISSSDTVMSTYASQDQSIAGIIDNLDQLGGSLNGMRSDINSLITNFAAVQQEFDRLITTNRTNIDATLSSLDSVVSLLAKDKTNLANTLCTLPAGLSAYFQTTSWGQWFNVRIVQVVLKDSSGNTIAAVNELPIQRGSSSQPPYSKCATRSTGKGPSSSSGSALAAAIDDPGFTDAQPFVSFVLAGTGGGTGG